MTFHEATKEVMAEQGMTPEQTTFHITQMNALSRLSGGIDVDSEIPDGQLEEYREWIGARVKKLTQPGFYRKSMVKILNKLAPINPRN